MLSKGMVEKGHNVEVWSPCPYVSSVTKSPMIRKWLGYFDQYVLFPNLIKQKIKECTADTLFVLTDQALGPWVAEVKDRPHVIHCHDFLAQRSARNEISDHKTSWTGRRYQSYIHKGYSKGKYFISVSQKTKEDLHRFLPGAPLLSEVVYNGLNYTFTRHNTQDARSFISDKTGLNLSQGYLLHVGGNQWYKNRIGVIEIYESFRELTTVKLPLLLVGQPPNQDIVVKVKSSTYKEDIHFLTNLDDNSLNRCYAGATVFLFPSLAEGFGWPIAEAMASGCPVITTNEAPMTEVAGQAAYFIPRRPSKAPIAAKWAKEAALIVDHICSFTPNEREKTIATGINNVERFDTETAITRIESIYRSVI